MPGLPRQHVDLVPHLNQAVDAKTAPPGVGILAQNAYRKKANEYRRRTGNSALGTSGVPSGTLPDIWQLGTHKDSLVALAKAGNAMPWVWSETAQRWSAADPLKENAYPIRSQARGAITSARRSIWAGETFGAATTLRPPIGSSVAVIPGTAYAVFVWQSPAASNTITEVVYDLASNTPMARTTLTGRIPRVEASGSAVTVAYYSSGAGTLVTRDWAAADVLTGAPGGGAATSITMDTPAMLDSAPTTTAGKIAFAWNKVAGTTVTVGIYNNSAHTFVTHDNTADASECLGILRDLQSTGSVYLVTAGATDGLKLHICNASTAVESSTVSLSTDSATAQANVSAITGFTTPNGTAGDYTVLWTVEPAAVSSTSKFDAAVYMKSRTAGELGFAVPWVRSVRLRSKPAVVTGSEVMVLVTYDSDVQPTYFLYSFPTRPSAFNLGPTSKIFRWRAVGKTANDELSQLTSIVPYGSTWLMALVRTGETRTRAGTVVTTNGVDMVTLTANPTATGRPVEFAESMMVPAGQVMAYDGARFNELNFCLYPEWPASSPYSLSAGGNLDVTSAAGLSIHNYALVYRFTDAQGRVHRSTPSVPLAVTLPDDGSEKTATLTIPYLRVLGFCDLIASKDAVVIELYRMEFLGTTFRLRAEIQNDPTTDSTTYTDLLGDATLNLLASTALYANLDTNILGPLENHTPPQFVAMCVHRGRLWGIDADDARRLWFSEPLAEGLGPVFNEALTVVVDDEWGDCTALASMDDKLIVFKRGALYAIVGDGPDNTGSGTYPDPHRIAVGPGTSVARSVQTTPDGVWFQSPKGLFLLDRGLNAIQRSEIQDSLGTATVRDVVHLDALGHVKLYLSDGGVLVWDYTFKEWYYESGQTLHGACRYGAKVAQIAYSIIDAQNVILISDSTVWTDNGVGYTFKITTAWIATGGIAGFQRIYDVMAVGEHVATSNLRVALSYDYVDTIAETREAVSAAPWQYKLKPARQKCHAIKVSVYDVVSGGSVPTTDTWRLSGLGMVVGVKAPGSKVPTAQRMGATTGGIS